MSTCIEVSNLTKLFRGRTVVDGLSFCVQEGEVKEVIESSPYDNLEEADLCYMGEEAVSMGVELDSIWKIVVLLVGITLF